MAVRFLPERGESAASASGDRVNLAEVIDLRSRLPRVVAPAASEEQSALEEAPDDPLPRSANEDAVRLLARKALSSGELRRELEALGHERAESEMVIAEFTESLYLDDAGLARLLAEGLRERARASRAQLRAKLRTRLLPDAVIEEILGEIDEESEDELLRATAQDRAAKLRDLDRQTAERRLLGYLARRGWSGESAIRACREALDAAGVGNGWGRAPGRPQGHTPRRTPGRAGGPGVSFR